MDQLPYELTRHIGKYLDYNSRVSYNVVTPKEGQFVKKLNSDSHNLKCKVALLTDKLILINTKTPIERARLIIEVFKYLATTNDTVLLAHSSQAFRNAILLKIKEFLDDERNYEIHSDPATIDDIKLNMVLAATSLKQKLDDVPFQKKFIPNYIQIL